MIETYKNRTLIMMGILCIGQYCTSCKCCDIIYDTLYPDGGKKDFDFDGNLRYWAVL